MKDHDEFLQILNRIDRNTSPLYDGNQTISLLYDLNNKIEVLQAENKVYKDFINRLTGTRNESYTKDTIVVDGDFYKLTNYEISSSCNLIEPKQLTATFLQAPTSLILKNLNKGE